MDMRKLAIRLMGAGLVAGMSWGMAPAILLQGGDAIAQDSGIANTAEDFKSAEANDGIFGSNVDIWDIMHRAGALNGAGVVDDGFYRSQNRRIDRQAESLRERQRAILEQRSANTLPPTAAEEATAE